MKLYITVVKRCEESLTLPLAILWFNFQMHVSAVGPDQMRVTWITDDDAPATVEYGTISGQYPFSTTGSTTSYSYIMYHSGNIHDAVVGPLKPSTTYYYWCSSDPSREFSFRMPPSALPISFVIAGT